MSSVASAIAGGTPQQLSDTTSGTGRICEHTHRNRTTAR
ncbi:hypothetical protein LEP1GSC165_0459, partial [Leptospira santarosai str. CBC523]